MPPKKPLKIEGLEKVLAQVPEADREKLRAEIMEKLGKLDLATIDSNPDVQRVIHLDPNPGACPKCGGAFKRMPRKSTTIPTQNGGGIQVLFVDCRECEASYSVPAPH